MFEGVNLGLILLAHFVASGSPGPTNLTIASLAMSKGIRISTAAAIGGTAASLTLSLAAAFGLGAVMLANPWALEIVRWLGVAYLLFLAYRFARGAFSGSRSLPGVDTWHSVPGAFARGFTIHLANPKPILFFAALYSVAVPLGLPFTTLILIALVLGVQTLVIFTGYALLFSRSLFVKAYERYRRIFEAVFAATFVLIALRILFSRLEAG